jgi:hypothetical protein
MKRGPGSLPTLEISGAYWQMKPTQVLPGRQALRHGWPRSESAQNPGSRPIHVPEQQSAFTVQMPPLQGGTVAQTSPLHSLPAPQSVLSGCPAQLQLLLTQGTAPQLPHEPPQPSSPQVLPWHCGWQPDGGGGGDAGGEPFPFFLCFFLCRLASLPVTPRRPSVPARSPTTAPRRDPAVVRPRRSVSNWDPSISILLVMSIPVPGVQSDEEQAVARWEYSPFLSVE